MIQRVLPDPWRGWLGLRRPRRWLRATRFARILQVQTSPLFDGNYKSFQLSALKRMANRWSGRVAYTLQESRYVGLGNPDARRVWLDNDPRADYGRFTSDRRHVLAASGTINPWQSLNIATVVPIPSVNVAIAVKVNAGERRSVRAA